VGECGLFGVPILYPLQFKHAVKCYESSLCTEMKNNILLQAELKKFLERAKTSPLLQSIFLRISGPAAEQRGARPLPIDENPIRTHFP